MTQLSFPEPERQRPNSAAILPDRSRFEGAMALSAVGDALGWPTETIGAGRRRPPSFGLPLRDFVGWTNFGLLRLSNLCLQGPGTIMFHR